MARGEPVGAEAQRVLVTDAELDFAIAGDVRIGRAAGRKFVEEMLEDAVPVLRRERHGVQRDAEIVADATRILQVGRCRAVTVLVFVPVAHEERVHVVPRALQQHGGDGGIDTAGEREHDAWGRHARILPVLLPLPRRLEGCGRYERSIRDLPPSLERQTRARFKRLIRDLPPSLERQTRARVKRSTRDLPPGLERQTRARGKVPVDRSPNSASVFDEREKMRRLVQPGVRSGLSWRARVCLSKRDRTGRVGRRLPARVCFFHARRER